MCPRPGAPILCVPMNVPGEYHTLHIELRFDGAAPTGNARLADGEPRAFSGWVGLVCAVEELVTEPEVAPAPT
jgi:hypothetical protein